MALHSLYCADVPLRNCSLTQTPPIVGREGDTPPHTPRSSWPTPSLFGQLVVWLLVQNLCTRRSSRTTCTKWSYYCTV